MKLKTKADGKNGFTIKPIILAAAVLAGSMSLLYAMVVTKTTTVATPQDKRQPAQPPATPAKDKAEFCPADHVITGFSLPVDKSDIEKTVTVTVCPKEKADKVKFRIEGEDRVDVKVTKIDEDTGKIEIEVKGKSATPKDKPDGDTTIEAKLGDDVIGKVQAIVVIPKTQTHSVGSASCVNSSDSPSDGKTKIHTRVEATVTITILDQFGNALNEVYDGTGVVVETWADVTELNQSLEAGPINKPTGILSSGVILDEVGAEYSHTHNELSNEERQDWANFNYIIASNNANNLFAYPNKSPLPYYQATQKIKLYGFSITPNFVRTMTVLSNNYPPVPMTLTDH